MSLIFDALRKSEAERRLGQAPTLNSIGPWPARRRSRPWLPWLALVVLVAIGLGYWQGRRGSAPKPTPPRAAVEAPATTPRSTPTLLPPPGTGAAQTTRTLPIAPAPAPRPPASGTRPPPASPAPMAATRNPNAPRDSIEDAEPAASALDPETRARFERGETFANNPQLLKPVRPTQEAPIVPPEGALPRPLDEPGVQAPPPAAVSGAPVAPAGGPLASPGATQPAAPSPVVPSPAPSDGAAVRELSELAPALRQALPPIRLTLHYYSADPARRFVILNGARCAEGDRSSDGLKVVAIRNDGVVLEFKGESFFIARGT